MRVGTVVPWMYEEFVLAPSLAICLPVHNAQATLDRLVRDALEVAVDLASRVDVIVIDDGSEDATSEITHELAMRYPQVRLLRQPVRMGRAMNMRLAVSEAVADIVVVRDEACQLSLSEVHKMWRHLEDHDVVLASADQEPVRGWTKWVRRIKPTLELNGMHLEEEHTRVDLQMIRRRAIETVRWTIGNRSAQIAELERNGYRWSAIHSVRRELGNIPSSPIASAPARGVDETSQDASSSPDGGQAMRQPNYLKHLRDFALGE